jgi:hypothetical protein
MTRNKAMQRDAVGFGVGHQCVEKIHSIGNSKVSP